MINETHIAHPHQRVRLHAANRPNIFRRGCACIAIRVIVIRGCQPLILINCFVRVLLFDSNASGGKEEAMGQRLNRLFAIAMLSKSLNGRCMAPAARIIN